jgi:hypothetical protein
MRLWSVLVCPVILLAAGIACVAEIAGTAIRFEVQYEGGSLPLTQGKIRAAIAGNELLFLHGGRKLAIPLESITRITYGTDHHKSVLCYVPFLELDRSYHVGLTWTDRREASNEAVLKLSEGKHRRFVATLEQLTGITAVNSDKAPAIVRF